jgi:hypothetical protein
MIPLLALVAVSFMGCDASGPAQADLSGHWKGQLVAVEASGQGPNPGAGERERPRRILMRLDQEAGTVSGIFAQSSDAVGFRRLDDATARKISTHTVSGTLDGQTIRLRFANDAGETFDVDGTVTGDRIAGTYSMLRGSQEGDEAVRETGEFLLEKY